MTIQKSTDMPLVSGPTVRKIVEAAGKGKTITAKVKNYADEIGVSEGKMWEYMKSGTAPRTSKNIKKMLATDAEIHNIK
jgi:hypothetical protein